MKKIIALVIGLAMLTLVSCVPVYAGSSNNDCPFVTVYSCWTYDVVYHKTTKVMYVISGGVHNQGTFTLLVNADNSPMVYTGE